MDYQGVVPKVGPLGFHHFEVFYCLSSLSFRYDRFQFQSSLCHFLSFLQGAVDMKINARVEATEMEAGFH